MSPPEETTTSAASTDSPASLTAGGCGCVPRGQLIRRVQCFEKRHQRCYLRRIEVPPVRGHVAAALQSLSHELGVRLYRGDPVQRGPSQATDTADRMTVAALLHLEDQGPLTLERRSPFEVLDRHRISAPRVHHGTPRRVRREVGERAEGHRHKQQRDDGNRSSLPALLALAGEERKQD